MKVVLFCGGLGVRLRDYSETIPKPMVKIGYRPILWHVMRYYAHYGHKDFILCLGWQAHLIKNYFLNYDECESNDFVLSGGGDRIRLLNQDIHDWNITFVDTGTTSNIGDRLRCVQPLLEDDECFLANYADGLTDLPLPELLEFHQRNRSLASFVAVRPNYSFHTVSIDGGEVNAIRPISDADVWMNGGYFVLGREVFDYMEEGQELVEEPFQRLVSAGRLHALQYDGYWGCMDTFKEKQVLEDLCAQGAAPWEVWKHPPRVSRQPR